MSRKKRPAAHRWLVAAALMANINVAADKWLSSDWQPSLKLLEYLGSLVDGPEGLIGPEVFADKSVEGQDSINPETEIKLPPEAKQTSNKEVRYDDQ